MHLELLGREAVRNGGAIGRRQRLEDGHVLQDLRPHARTCARQLSATSPSSPQGLDTLSSTRNCACMAAGMCHHAAI